MLKAGGHPADGAGSGGAVIPQGLRDGAGRMRRSGASLEQGYPHCDLVAEFSWTKASPWATDGLLVSRSSCWH